MQQSRQIGNRNSWVIFSRHVAAPENTTNRLDSFSSNGKAPVKCRYIRDYKRTSRNWQGFLPSARVPGHVPEGYSGTESSISSSSHGCSPFSYANSMHGDIFRIVARMHARYMKAHALAIHCGSGKACAGISMQLIPVYFAKALCCLYDSR